MWMGGTVPLGYRVKDRKLVVDAVEADSRAAIYVRSHYPTAYVP